MSTTGVAHTLSWSVAGFGGASGAAYSWSTDDGALVDPLPDPGGSVIDVLDPIGSSGGYTIRILSSATDAYRLLRQSESYYTDSDQLPVRITEYLTASATSIEVTDGSSWAAGLPKRAWFRAECVSVTARAGTTLTVTRAQLSTQADPIPCPSDPDRNGLVLWQEPVDVVGRRCFLWRAEGDAQPDVPFVGVVAPVVIHYGVVTAVRESHGVIEVDVASELQLLRERTYRVPEATDASWAHMVLAVSSVGRLLGGAQMHGAFTVDPREWGPTEWTYARVECVGGAWFVIPVAKDFAIDGIDYYSHGSTTVLQWGTGNYVRALADLERAFPHPGGGDTYGQLDVTRVSYAVVSDSGSLRWSDLVTALLASTIGDIGARVSTAVRPNTQIVHDVTGGRTVHQTGASDPGVSVLPAQWEGVSHADILSRDVLGPWGLALVTGADGLLRIIDWQERSEYDAAILAAHWATGDYSVERDSYSPVYEARLSASAEAAASTRRDSDGVQQVGLAVVVRSDVAASTGIGRPIQFDDLALWGDASTREAIVERWSHLLWTYGRSVPILKSAVSRAISVEVGQYVSVTHPLIVDADGTRGVTACAGIVLERGEITESGVQPIRIALVGYGRTTADAAAGVWAPCARVDGAQAATTTITIEAAAYVDSTTTDDYPISDANAWSDRAGAALLLLDQYHQLRSDNAVALVSVIGTTLTVDTAFESGAVDLALQDGDIVVLAPWDDQGADEQESAIAWLATAGGKLGVDTDPARTWS